MNRNRSKKPVRIKNGRLKNYILMIVQALLGVLMVVCVFQYHIISLLTVEEQFESYSYTPGFSELSGSYYDSDIYTENLYNSVYDVIRYVTIREQFETDGKYDPQKIINVGEFYNRYNGDYSGPEASYYLEDLIDWGKKETVSHDYKVFFSTAEYNDFFKTADADDSGYEDLDSMTVTGDVDDDGEGDYLLTAENGNTVVAYLDTINNTYTTVDGKNLEECVSNGEDYTELSKYLEGTIQSLCSNYDEYVKYQEKFSTDVSNIRYVVTLTKENSYQFYSNITSLNSTYAESKINDTIKKFGEYMMISPGSLNYLTNTPLQYETVNAYIESYEYSFPDNSRIWVAVDTSYPVSDVFSENLSAFEKAGSAIPWIVSSCALSLILFVAILFYMIVSEKNRLNSAGAGDTLTGFDKLPIEMSFLFFVLLVIILYIGEALMIRYLENLSSDRITYYYIPVSALGGIDLFVVLMFFYGFVRRIICRNVFEGSFISALIPKFSSAFSKIRSTGYGLYDDSGTIVTTWGAYVAFLIFNVFWILMYLFKSQKVICLIIVGIFDIIVGISLFVRKKERNVIIESIRKISAGEYDTKIDYDSMHGENRRIAIEVNKIGEGISQAVETSIKDEKLKADLITNVSHDIKTPLTSIINYVELIKRENIDNERVNHYVEILDEKSQRLRQLTFDLVEASKITSGNITIDFVKINFVELLGQSVGEFEEKFDERGLTVVTNAPKTPVYIMADPRYMWRVIENLFNNIYKYALENTRIYIDLVETEENSEKVMAVSIKNISKNELNISADELTERFIRGDVARSTEGSGLGLSIAKSLTKAQNGVMSVYLDGDLFKVTLTFKVCE